MSIGFLFFHGLILLVIYSRMYQNRLENIVQIIEVQNAKLLESKQKELPKSKEIVIDYEDADYYDYNEYED